MENYGRKSITSKLSAYKKPLLGIAVLAVVLFLVVRFNPFSGDNNSSVAGASKTVIKDAVAKQDLNREFRFPLKDEKGGVLGEIKYVVENAELRDEIVVKGKKASAVAGRTFLVLNLKVTNDTNQTISMNTKDYVRLFINGNDNEPLSPSIHNDPVVVDAISVKSTRIGFAINESDNQLKLKIGEIQGEKQEVLLELDR